MNAKQVIQLVVEGRTPYGWETTRGVYANLSNWPHEIKYYIKCPICGLIHDGGTTMKATAEMKLCTTCNMDVINKLKDEVQDVLHDPEHKPKAMRKIVGESNPDADADVNALIGSLPSRVDHLATLVKAKTCTKEEAVEYAIIQAESVLHIFEKEFPDDKRPRQAIEAARKWWREPSEANRLAAYAAYAAADAAYAATNAAYAAYAATNAACAAYAYAARDAAAYAAAAASAAIDAAYWAVEAQKSAAIAARKRKTKPVRESVADDAPFDPFDAPPDEHDGVPVPPGDEPSDTVGEIDRLLLGNWVDVAKRDFAEDAGVALSDVEIDVGASVRNHYFDPDDLSSATIIEFSADGMDYLLFKDYDTLEAYALKRVRSDLENEPGMFTQSWLRVFVDEDRLKRAIGDPYEYWEDEEVGHLDYDELLAKMVEENRIESDDSRFFKANGDPRIENPVRVKALDAVKDAYVEECKPKIEDPWDWLEDVYGKEEASTQGIKMVCIDIDKAAAAAIAADGAVHFCNSYDGHQNDLENGAIYIRTN